jgi:predicted DNA-binding transcriptional regulator AlpA
MRAGTKIISIDELQRVLHQHKNVQRVAQHFGISVHTVYYHMARHGLRCRNITWTTERDNYLIFNAYHKSHRVLAKHLGCTVAAVKARIRVLGMSMRSCIGYTSADFARDCGMTVVDVRGWWLHRGMPIRKVSQHVHVDYDEAVQWLAAGNVYRIQDISQACAAFREIHAQCELKYIRTDEIQSLCSFKHHQAWQPPSPVLQVDTGYVYLRSAFAEWLAWNVHLIYAGARSEYVECIRDEARARYVTSMQLAGFSSSIMHDLWRLYKSCDFPEPIRKRPNVWERGPVLAWLRERRHKPKYAALYQYLVRIS